MVKNSGNVNLKIVDSSKGVKTISTEEIEGHVRPWRGPAVRGKGEQQTRAEHAPGEFNPHIWLDPKRAIRQVKNIRDYTGKKYLKERVHKCQYCRYLENGAMG
jgi:zinc/manganese transport system substrate-binding protein